MEHSTRGALARPRKGRRGEYGRRRLCASKHIQSINKADRAGKCVSDRRLAAIDGVRLPLSLSQLAQIPQVVTDGSHVLFQSTHAGMRGLRRRSFSSRANRSVMPAM